jgi:phytoene/squalene synthetase
VDSFHDYNKAELFARFEQSLEEALADRISLNPILNSFQETVHRYNIDREYINAFMQSMHWDLSKKTYLSEEEYKAYIYGSADVVGLMCLKVFVKGDDTLFESLKDSAMRLGSAFQKVNFLRDLKADHEHLERSYFPNVDMNAFDEDSKQAIIDEIEADFSAGLKGIFQLPDDAKFGVYTAYKYYLRLLKKLKKTPSTQIKSKRIRVPNYQKVDVLARSFIRYQFNLL